jgi:stage IV sporulation protein FB
VMQRGFKVVVSPGALLIIAAAICFLDTDMLICLALSVFCHEAGHFLALKLFHTPVRSLSVTITGLSAVCDRTELTYGAEALCVLAGPLFGALLAFSAAAAGYNLLAGVSMLLTLFNLIPVYPLDGGRLLELIMSYIFGVATGEKVARTVGAAVSFLLFVLGIYMCLFMRGGLTLPLLGAWLLSDCCKTSSFSVK